MKILLPLSTRRVYRRATVFQVMRTTLLIAVLIAAVGCGASLGIGRLARRETELTIIATGRDGREPRSRPALDAPLQPRRWDDAADDGDLRAAARG